MSEGSPKDEKIPASSPSASDKKVPAEEEEEAVFANWKEYYKYRLKHSAIHKFLRGSISVEDADTLVNAFSLVAALVLTVPFSMVTALGSDYWDWLKANLKTCGIGSGNEDYFSSYAYLTNALNATVYSAILCLLLAVTYYILRPKDKHFGVWWRTGKLAVLGMFFTLISSVISGLVVFGSFCGFYAAGTEELCDVKKYENPVNFITAAVIVLSTWFIGILLMI